MLFLGLSLQSFIGLDIDLGRWVEYKHRRSRVRRRWPGKKKSKKSNE